MLAELCAKDRFTFKQISDSVRLREAFEKYGYHIPKKPQDIRDLVMAFYKKVKEYVKVQIQEMLKLKKRFSLTSDEWTGLMNKRFMNVNAHTEGLTLNLGLVSINGSMPAEIAKELTIQRLTEYGLDILKDIVCSTTDGASVMTRYGKLLDPVLHLQCYNHAYHLAVVAFLYATEVEDDEDEVDDDVVEDENWDENEDEEAMELNIAIQDIVKRVRKAVKIFRKSPVKNDTYLQKHVMADPNIGHRLSLIIDSKTR